MPGSQEPRRIGPVALPSLTPRDVIGSVVGRIAVVALVAGVFFGLPYLGISDPLEALLATNLPAICALTGALWVFHWLYRALWKANKDAPAGKLIRWAGRLVTMLGLILVLSAWAAYVPTLDAVAASVNTGAPLTYTPWDILWAPGLARIERSGILVTLTLVALAGLAKLCWGLAAHRLPVNEATWWLDGLVRQLCCAAYLASALAVITSCAVHVNALDPSFALWFTGGWIEGTRALIAQATEAGCLSAFMCSGALWLAWRRLRLWRQAREAARGADDPLCAAIARISGFACAYAVAWIALRFASAFIYLVYPAGLAPDAVANILTALFLGSETIIAAVAGCLLSLGRYAVHRWYRTTGSEHGFLRGLGVFAITCTELAIAGWLLVSIGRTCMDAGVVWVLFNEVQLGLAAPNIWGRILSLVVTVVTGLMALCVVGGIALAMFGGAGGGAAAGGGGGGGAASGGGGGFSSGSTNDAQRSSINDRYGRKIAGIEEGLTGTRVTDRWGATRGRVRHGIDGTDHVTIDDETYEVRDASFSSDRIVRKDGEEVGRIRESAVGDDPWYDPKDQ